MKRTVTLIETIVAVTIFSILSLSLYFLLYTGITVRERIQSSSQAYQDCYLSLENIARELRSSAAFSGDKAQLSGDSASIEFFTLLFDYPESVSRLRIVKYNFEDGALAKVIKEPLEEEPVKEFDYMENLESFKLYYFDNSAGSEEQWKEEWQNSQPPEGVKIELTFNDKKGRQADLNKFVTIYR